MRDFINRIKNRFGASVLSSFGRVEEADAAYRRGDFIEAVRITKPLAEQGDAAAQLLLGLMYRFGQGVPCDYTISSEWLRPAAERTS